MGDKELLELAAKASGIPGRYIRIDDGHNPLEVGIGDLTGTWWNPLVDDGDALRLALYLGMRVSLRQADADGGSIRAFGEEEDSYAATRRAIVKAAAEIGKTEKA